MRLQPNITNRLKEYGIYKIGTKSKPYRVVVASTHIGMYKTLEEAKAARDDAVEFLRN